jgi:hypothetical protein
MRRFSPLVRSLALVCLLVAGSTAWAEMVVDGVGTGWAAQRAGVRAGDRLLAVADAAGRFRPLTSTYDLRELEIEEGGQRSLPVESGPCVEPPSREAACHSLSTRFRR